MYSDQIIGIDSGSDGKLYIAHSYEPVISSYDGENWDYQTLGIPQQYNTDFLIDMHGNFWLATYDGLYELSDSRTKNHFRWAPLYDRSISGIWESPDTAIWAAWNGHGIARFDGEEWIAYSASNVLDCDYVNGFYFDSKGAIWLATTCGIYKTDNLSSLHSTLIGRERSVAVYPNPVGDALNIEFESSNSADITIAVYSIDGRLLTSENDFYQREYNNVYTAETHDWPSGVLICTVREGTRLYTTKFIKTQY
jgi:streptogramin lyase